MNNRALLAVDNLASSTLGKLLATLPKLRIVHLGVGALSNGFPDVITPIQELLFDLENA